ncbi:MAG: MoaD family protein [Pyrobaculum sp.]
MRVVVKIFGPRYFGLSQYDVVTHVLELGDGATVRDVVDELDRLYPGLRSKLFRGDSLISMHDVWVNGRSIDFLKGLATELRDGDVVQIIPPFGG